MVRKDLMDELDRRIVAELEKDARASNRAIARRVGVSAPTVAQRIRRLEDVGLIRGYRVDLAVPASVPSAQPGGLRCAECKNEIHGPARTRRHHGKSYAFCCPMCEEKFGDRMERFKRGTKGIGASVVLLGWVATFGILGATCMGMGTCLGPGLAPAPQGPCPPGARGRDEFEEAIAPAGGDWNVFRGPGWSSIRGRQRPFEGGNVGPGD